MRGVWGVMGWGRVGVVRGVAGPKSPVGNAAGARAKLFLCSSRVVAGLCGVGAESARRRTHDEHDADEDEEDGHDDGEGGVGVAVLGRRERLEELLLRVRRDRGVVCSGGGLEGVRGRRGEGGGSA